MIAKKLVSVLMALVCVCSLALCSVNVSAANYSTNYNGYTTPSASDYAYWNGSRTVRASGTTTSKIKWMQAALNYCIENKDLKNKNNGTKASYLDVDGSFGPASKEATMAFQKKYSLKQDGSFGPGTIARMKEVLKGQYPPKVNNAAQTIFTKKNYLQIDSKWNTKKYNNSYLKDSGCGIFSIVNAVYNSTGNFVDPYTVADWAHGAKYFNQAAKGGGVCNQKIFTEVANKYGSTYGFKYIGHGTSFNNNTLKNHLKNGGTAIVHVQGHYMCLVGYDSSTGKFLVYDPAPGSGTNYNSIKRKGLTSPNGDWKTASQLSTGAIAITEYWMYAKR